VSPRIVLLYRENQKRGAERKMGSNERDGKELKRIRKLKTIKDLQSIIPQVRFSASPHSEKPIVAVHR
jgi:hypothetical protein